MIWTSLHFLFVFSILTLFKSVFCYDYEVKYLNVKLDHFTYTNTKTFKLKYLISDKYWDKRNGPIFFYCGNEGAIELFCENTGFLWEAAEKFNALVLFAEHRYYGESLPFGNKSFDSVENRGYLSSFQALEDFVDVIEHVQKKANDALDRAENHEWKQSKRFPVIAFGGSYGGMLASWFRMKYPHVVQGSLASSAPIWDFIDMAPCNNFMKIVTKVFADTSKVCHDTIKQSWNLINDITHDDDGKYNLTKQWHLCTPIKTKADVFLFKSYLSDMYTTMAMVNYPYPNDFLVPLPGHPIKKFCELLETSKQSDKLLKIFDASQMYLNATKKEPCFDWVEGSSINDLGLLGWILQTCTEMTMPFCSTDQEMFEPSPWSFEVFSAQCWDSFKVKPIPDIAEKLYGGTRINAASNIIFSNGLLDPWSGGGVLHNISDTVVAVIIPEGAHHLDLRSANKEDPQSVIDARKFYLSTFKRWIETFSTLATQNKEIFGGFINEVQNSNSIETNDISSYWKTSSPPKSKNLRKSGLANSKTQSLGKYLGMFHPILQLSQKTIQRKVNF